MRRLLGLLTAAIAALTPAERAAAQYVIGARDSQALRVDSVFRSFDRTDGPGCALGVYQDGKLRYGRGYGLASLELSVPISPRTVLDVGSISKQFTAMSVLILAKEGKLSLDDPIRKHFPEMPAYADGITWRRALSQTSGLRDLWTMWGQTGRTFAGDTVDALHIIYSSAEPNYIPGERYLYTNTGWILAAQLVYRLTGKTLAEFAKERIFTPLGMRDTRFLSDRDAVIPNLAESYGPDGNTFQVRRNPYDGAIMGAGGIHTTVEDFGRWLDNYDTGVVGGPDVIRTMTTATALNDGSPATSSPGMAYAIGLTVGTERGLRVVAHGGAWGGFRGHFLRFPDQRFAVSTFCNVTNAGPSDLARKVAAVYLDDRMEPDTTAAWADALAKEARVPMSAASLRSFAGVWRNVDLGQVRRTKVEGDSLVLVGNPNTVLEPLGGGRFRAGKNAEARFEGDLSAPSSVIVRNAGGPTVYERAEPAELDAPKLAEYAGDYRNDEVEVTHTWKVEKGKLAVYAGYRRLGELEPSYRDGFTLGFRVIDVVRDRRGRLTGYLVESGRVRHLRFTRVR